jgi:hypothetical protein
MWLPVCRVEWSEGWPWTVHLHFARLVRVQSVGHRNFKTSGIAGMRCVHIARECWSHYVADRKMMLIDCVWSRQRQLCASPSFRMSWHPSRFVWRSARQRLMRRPVTIRIIVQMHVWHVPWRYVRSSTRNVKPHCASASWTVWKRQWVNIQRLQTGIARLLIYSLYLVAS